MYNNFSLILTALEGAEQQPSQGFNRSYPSYSQEMSSGASYSTHAKQDVSSGHSFSTQAKQEVSSGPSDE